MGNEGERSFKRFGIRQTTKRFNRAALQLGLARQSTIADAVHDLRVSIRRLSAALDCFARLFDKKELRDFQGRIERILKAAGAVRDYDIALELASAAGVEQGSPLVESLSEKRRQHALALQQELRRGSVRRFSARWRGRFGLN